MDPALLREREAFRKKAFATPVIENKKKKEVVNDEVKKRPKLPPKSSSNTVKIDATNYKLMAGSAQYKFGVLAKIVKHLKTIHQGGGDYALTFDEILDETNQLDVSMKIRQWLKTEALGSNPKIETTSDGRYAFKPPYKVRDRKGL